MPGLSGLALTKRESFEVLTDDGWTEIDAVHNLTELAALGALDGKRVLVLDQNAVYTLDASSVVAADGTRVVARTGGVGAGRWFLFQPRFDMLWVCQQFIDTKLFGFSGAQASTIDQLSAPAVTLTLPALGPADGHAHTINALGFAPNGDMWIGYADTNPSPGAGQYLAKLSASKLLATASVTPDFSFPVSPAPFSVSSNAVSSITVRPNGDLWLSTVALDTRSAGIYCYSAASIAAPGSPAPAVVLAQAFPPVPDNPLHTHAANDLWFDSAGNLWFTDAVASTVNRLSAAQLLVSNAAIVPEVILTVGQYTGVTIDTAGNLWCAAGGSTGDNLDMFGRADALVSGTPAVVRRISTTGGSARKVRFDRDGNLWSLAPTGPHGYPRIDVAGSGSPPPRCTLTGAGALTAARVLNFNPASFH